MSSLPTTTPAMQWPADVLAYAAKHQLEEYLDPLLEATRRLFPTARSIRVWFESDPELHDVHGIVYDVRVRDADIPDFVKAVHTWTDELYRICPAPLVCHFVLSLVPE